MTMGTAIRHAQDNGLEVAILVRGVWMEGSVINLDGHGAVLNDGDHATAIRLDAVDAVRFVAHSLLALDPMAPCPNHIERPGVNCPTCGY
jgi:hypothetical protein